MTQEEQSKKPATNPAPPPENGDKEKGRDEKKTPPSKPANIGGIIQPY